MPLCMDADDGNPLGGKAIAELFVEQRVSHGARQEHRYRPARSAVPHRQHNRHARGGYRQLFIALRMLDLVAQPLIPVTHTHHLNPSHRPSRHRLFVGPAMSVVFRTSAQHSVNVGAVAPPGSQVLAARAVQHNGCLSEPMIGDGRP